MNENQISGNWNNLIGIRWRVQTRLPNHIDGFVAEDLRVHPVDDYRYLEMWLRLMFDREGKRRE